MTTLPRVTSRRVLLLVALAVSQPAEATAQPVAEANDAAVPGERAATDLMEEMTDAVADALRSQDWPTARAVAWSAFLESTSLLEASVASELQIRPTSFLKDAAHALMMQADESASQPQHTNAESQRLLNEAGNLRDHALAILRVYDPKSPAGGPGMTECIMTLMYTSQTANRLNDQTLYAAWEEANGDAVAHLPEALQRDLPRSFMPDDAYFRAARAAVRTSDDTVEAERLLAKIDSLAVSRESSAFHAAGIVDELSATGRREPAFELARRWLDAYPADPNAALLINRVAALATSLAPSLSTQRAQQIATDLDQIAEQFEADIARHDRNVASKQRGATDLPRWRRNMVASQVLLAQVELAAAAGDASEVIDLGSRFVAEYPNHPGIPGVDSQVLRFTDLHDQGEE